MFDRLKRAFTTSRIERELERERHEHAINRESKTGLNPAENERSKDARANSESGKVRR